MRFAKSFVGHPTDPAKADRRPPPPARREPANNRSADAVSFWLASAESIAGTPAEIYLRGRHLDPARLPAHSNLSGWPAALRFNAGACCLVVAVNDAHTGLVVAVQRIMLHRDGTPKRRPDGRKLKLSLGPVNGNAARFGWHPDPRGRWGLAEGPETALAAALQGGFPVVASLGTDNMPNVAPPSWASSVVIFADHDEAGMRAAGDTIAVLRKCGLAVRAVRAPKSGADAADVLAEVAPHA